MIIAHLPAAIVLRCTLRAPSLRHPAFLLGAVLPDLDMLWFHLVDGGAVHHHDYLTHRPVTWLAVLVAGRALGAPVTALGLGCLLHVALDSLTGRIAWGWPISDLAGPLVSVPATRDWWVASFVTHWTFGVELAICAMAGVAMRGRR